MLGYVYDTSMIWWLWDPIEGHVIQASNVKFDESLVEGKRVIDEKSNDTLQSLANSENTDIEVSNDNSRASDIEAIPRGLLVAAEQGSSEIYQDLRPQAVNAEEAKSPIILNPNSYAEAIACAQRNGWKRAMQEEYGSLKENKT